MTARLPAAPARKVVKALERAHFIVHHTRGGHTIMRHITDVDRRVTIPIHGGDLKPGTMRVIIKQSGLSVEEFVALL